MIPARIIQKKRDGKRLTAAEIRAFVHGLLDGKVADYQMSAFLMAVFFRSMDLAETVALTQAMLSSGERWNLSSVPGPKADKHSTGGVGDKVSLILAPLAAACGLKVPMMSGRGLGHTGGTLDKLESIPGFEVRLERPRAERVLREVGCVMIGQSEGIAPADRKMYALRDVTGTVECIPLIVASILSKKLAEGTESLVLDVKVGNGAFMKNLASARALARELTRVARKSGLKCNAVLSDMSQPLGYSVGNALEVLECIQVMTSASNAEAPYRFSSPVRSDDLVELTLFLCAEMIRLAGVRKNHAKARALAEEKLRDGSAWRIFQKMVEAQGGPAHFEASHLRLSPNTQVWRAAKTGYIECFHTEALGHLLLEMGGGRRAVSDSIDASVGFVLHKKIGDAVKKGEPLATAFLSPQTPGAHERSFNQAIAISRSKKNKPRLILR